jgi:hypothetical protein
MSGWKARIGYLSPSVFETPSDWDLILPRGFTIVSSGLNVQSHTEMVSRQVGLHGDERYRARDETFKNP